MPDAAQDVGDLLVAGRDSRLRVDDEDDEVGLLDRAARLLGDLLVSGEASATSTPPVSTSRKRLPAHSQTTLLAVARDAGRLEDDGLPRRRQAVDERRLPDVRKADDRDGAQERRVGHAGATGLARAAGGVASRGRPSSCIRPSHSHSRRISASISASPPGSP